MHNAHCLNCGTALYAHQEFCSHCGQKADTTRFTFKQLLHDLLHAFIHAEKGILRLLKGLAFKPGTTAAAFVEGKRKTYFNPFTFLAICIAFVVFVNNWIKPYGNLPVPDKETLASMPNQRLKDIYLVSVERNAKIQDFGNKNMNLLTVLISPYFACGLWLFFRRRKRNAAEITVAYILFTAFSTVLTTIFISPLLAFYRNTAAYYPIEIGSLFLQTMYIAWGLNTFFKFRTAREYLKVLSVLCLIGVAGFILLTIALVIYVYRGSTFEVLQHL